MILSAIIPQTLCMCGWHSRLLTFPGALQGIGDSTKEYSALGLTSPQNSCITSCCCN